MKSTGKNRRTILTERLNQFVTRATSQSPIPITCIGGIGSYFRKKEHPKDIDIFVLHEPYDPDEWEDNVIKVQKQCDYNTTVANVVSNTPDIPNHFKELISCGAWSTLYDNTYGQPISPSRLLKRFLTKNIAGIQLFDIRIGDETSIPYLGYGTPVRHIVWSTSHPNLQTNLENIENNLQTTIHQEWHQLSSDLQQQRQAVQLFSNCLRKTITGTPATEEAEKIHNFFYGFSNKEDMLKLFPPLPIPDNVETAIEEARKELKQCRIDAHALSVAVDAVAHCQKFKTAYTIGYREKDTLLSRSNQPYMRANSGFPNKKAVKKLITMGLGNMKLNHLTTIERYLFATAVKMTAADVKGLPLIAQLLEAQLLDK